MKRKGWECTEPGWWHYQKGGAVCREMDGWYAYPSPASEKRIGPFRVAWKAMENIDHAIALASPHKSEAKT